MGTVRLCVFGSRTFSHADVCDIIRSEISKHEPEFLITAGEAKGVCECARDIAREDAIPIELHFLNNTKYAAGKYEHRSKSILSRSDFVVFIHDGASQGTKNEMEMAKEMGVPYSYHLAVPSGGKLLLEDWKMKV